MKNIYKSLWVLPLLMIGLSCEENFEHQNQDISITQAKEWFEEYAQGGTNSTKEGADNSANPAARKTAAIGKQIFWDKAIKIGGKGLPNGYAVPIWYEGKYRFRKQTIRELWVFKDDKGKMKSQIIEILADNKNFIKNGYKLDMSNFTGGITIHDWKDGFQGGLYYKDGVLVGYIDEYEMGDKKSGLPKKANTNQRTSSDCGYQTNFVENGVIVIGWHYQECTPQYFWTQYNQNPYFAQSWVDSQYGCEVTSTCVGGETSPPPYYEAYDQIARDQFNFERIINPYLKPCMVMVLNSLKTIPNGSVAEIIQKFSAEIPGFNWELKDGTLQGLDNANTLNNYNAATGAVTTIFDPAKFLDASDLSIARTIMHEAIHAYVVAVQYNTTSAGERAALLGPDWVSFVQNYGHDYITNNYLMPLAFSLQEYGNSILGFSYSSQFYLDLAWGGLSHKPVKDAQGNTIMVETDLFKSLVPNASDRRRITDNIAVEQTGKDTSGYSKTQKGNDAGC